MTWTTIFFRQELGIVKSNDPRAEYTDENDDDFDEEKKYSQQKGSKQAGSAKSKTPVLDNFGRDITKLAEIGIAWILLLAGNRKLKEYRRYFPAVKRITRF